LVAVSAQIISRLPGEPIHFDRDTQSTTAPTWRAAIAIEGATEALRPWLQPASFMIAAMSRQST
jgi:hypothetical protein